MFNHSVFLHCYVSSHCHCLQVYLRPHHDRANIEHHATFQVFDHAEECQEVAAAGRAVSCSIKIWVLVNDTLPNANVYSNWDAQAVA